MNAFQVTLTSDKDVSVMFKAWNNTANEKTVSLTANTPVTITHQIGTATTNTSDAMYVFIAPNVADGSTGTVTFSNFSLLKANFAGDEDTSIKINNISYYESGYTVSSVENGFKIDFADKASGRWNNLQAVLVGTKLSEYTKLTGTVVSTVDISFIVKPYNSNDNEVNVQLKANESQNLEKILTVFDANQPVYFFVAFGDSDPTSGSVTVTNLTLSKATE